MSENSDPDFVERNGVWMLSVLGVFMSCLSGILVYMLKSRCKKIKCACIECERDVLDQDAVVEIEAIKKRRGSSNPV